MSWTESFLKSSTKKDLENKILCIFSEHKPKELPSGMFDLIVGIMPKANGAYDKMRVVTVTRRDITDILNSDTPYFTFQKSPKGEFYNVIGVKAE